MDTVIISQMSMNLTIAFSLIIMVFLILAVGLGILSGLAWLYMWVGKWTVIILRKQYGEAMDVFSEKPKKART